MSNKICMIVIKLKLISLTILFHARTYHNKKTRLLRFLLTIFPRRWKYQKSFHGIIETVFN
jgi:hypothetical protein